MKTIYLVLVSLLLITACDNDLDQIPPKQGEASSLTDFANVLNAAYHYQTGAATSLAVMGDFRADNALMFEEPYPAFDRFNSDLAGGDLVEQFFRPFYINLYKSILSANAVITNSSDENQIAEAKFLRALSYFKLVKVFGDVTVILTPQPDIADIPNIDLIRQSASSVYSNVIIPDLQDAIANLDNSVSTGRASTLAAQGILGKVYMQMGNLSSAETQLAAVINGAAGENVSLEANFEDVVTDGNSEIIFATQMSTSVPDVYGFTELVEWFAGDDTKAPNPLDPDLTAAFDAAGDTARKALTIDEANGVGVKYTGALEQDYIELRLSDVILLYAEALNENTNANGAQSATILTSLDAIRTRAGLASLSGTATTQATVRDAIAQERRLELAFEGHRWFDLVRTGTVDAEMGEAISSNYHVFPIPNSEILASGGVITQNAGY